MRVGDSYDPQAAVDRGVALARAAYARLDEHGADGLGAVRTRITNREGSFFNRVTKRVIIGVGGEDATGPHGRLSTLENTIHEVSHKWFDARAGFLGLVSAGQSGALSEGIAQVMAGAALVLAGDTEEQAWGWKVLDPHGQTAIIQRPFGPSVRVPLSTTMADVRRVGFTLVDAGYIHVHAGVVQAAHYDMARALGVETMARITTEAARASMTPFTGFRGWADATIETATRLYGNGSAAATAVLQAWQAAEVLGAGGE